MGSGMQAAGRFEEWAARLWNVFNEGKPFGIVYPPMAVAGAALVGWADPAPAMAVAVVLSLVWARFAFPLRSRVLLWVLLVPGFAVLEGWRSWGLIVVGLGGWAFFTVLFWGSLYYHLRTGAPWTNFTRFWRLVATNSDPTSGNALEQVPKLILTLSAAGLAGHEADGWWRIVAVAVVAAGLGVLADRWFARRRMVAYPAPALPEPGGDPLAERVYAIVIDGCNRDRLRQASAVGLTPTIDRLIAEGTEYTQVDTAYPARTVVCFSSMLTGATPSEHGMRSNFAPRLGVRVPSVFDVLAEHGRRGRLVGIAHLLDPFGHEHVRSVTSVQPTTQLDHSLAGAAIEVWREEGPDLLVAQLLAADQIGHVRGTRNAEYLDQLAATDGRIAELLEAWDLEGATVILMADHGQGRGIGGHGHLDWGETPIPFVVWGAAAVPGAVCHRASSILELAVTVSRLLGVPAPAAARGRPLVPALDPDVVAPTRAPRALAVVTAYDEEATIGAIVAALAAERLDVLVVDDGSTDATAALARTAGARVVSHGENRGLGAALRTGLEIARDEDYDAALYIDGDGEYDPAQAHRVLAPVLSGRAQHVLGSRFLGRREDMSWHRTLANRASSALMGVLLGGQVLTDGQTGMRAFGREALAVFDIAHDYNYAQVLTLDLGAKGFPPLEVPIDYTRRRTGRSFVRYPEYARRVVPAVWRVLRHSKPASTARPPTSRADATDAHTPEPVP